jgi:hypothetical protein
MGDKREMAFCTKCGTQLSDNATLCPTCGQPRVPASSPSAAGPSITTGLSPENPTFPSATPAGSGFLASLFDFSFTRFVTTKLIKILYAIGVAVAAIVALGFTLSAFGQNIIFGLVTLFVLAPLVFLTATIYWRVMMELVIVLFRAAEHLAEIARQARR